MLGLVQDLLKTWKMWKIVGMDPVSQVICQQSQEWKEPTNKDWAYRLAMSCSNGSTSQEPGHVRPTLSFHPSSLMHAVSPVFPAPFLPSLPCCRSAEHSCGSFCGQLRLPLFASSVETRKCLSEQLLLCSRRSVAGRAP